MGLEDIIEIIKDAEFFSICNEEQLRLLAFASERRHYDAKEIIVDKIIGYDGAYIIINGDVSVSDDLERGNNSYIISGANTLVGERSLLLNKPLRSLIIANSEVEALFVPHKAFYKLLQQYPDIATIIKQRIETELDNYLRAFDGFR